MKVYCEGVDDTLVRFGDEGDVNFYVIRCGERVFYHFSLGPHRTDYVVF